MTIKTLQIFFTAMGYYFIATTPLLIAPEKYLLSLAVALIYGWIAWAFFMVTFWLLHLKKMELESKWILLITSIPISIAIALFYVEIDKNWHVYWSINRYYLFTALASCCAWYALFTFRKEIHQHFITSNNS
jgi:hypothetical protein